MNKNKNRLINQFLQSKSYQSHNNYIINTSTNSQSYFNKKIFNNTSKKICPNLESLHEDYLNYDNNLKTSYNLNNYNNHYTINNHNHSEYITNNSSDNFPKILINRRERKKFSKINFTNSPVKGLDYYNKTEDNIIRRVHSSNYKNKTEEDSRNKYEQKLYNTNTKEKVSINIIQSSPSLPLLFKSKYNFEENPDQNSNYKGKKIYMEKTFTNRKNNINDYQNNFINHSIRNFHSDTEKRNKQIKNYKSSNIIKPKKVNTFINNNMHIHNNLIDKDNQKNHSIIMRKRDQINKEEMRNDFKKKYNINNLSQNDTEINKYKSDNSKNVSPNTVPNNNKNNNRIIIKKIINNKEKENKELKDYQNHSLFESINLKKFKQKEITKNNKLNKNINTFLDSENLLKNKIYINNNYINNKRIQIIDDKVLKNNYIDKKNNKKIFNNNYKLEIKDKNSKLEYD